jgi:hypothetical protein
VNKNEEWRSNARLWFQQSFPFSVDFNGSKPGQPGRVTATPHAARAADGAPWRRNVKWTCLMAEVFVSKFEEFAEGDRTSEAPALKKLARVA